MTRNPTTLVCLAAALAWLALPKLAVAQEPPSETKEVGVQDASHRGGATGAPKAGDERSLDVLWEPSLDVALARAKRLGRPVIVALHKPSSKLSQDFLSGVYVSVLVRSVLRELVCVAASTEATAPLTEGPRKGKSAVFRTVTSAEAEAVTAVVAKRYLGDEAENAPVHLFVNGDGHLILTLRGRRSAKDFLAALEDVLDKSDPAWRPPSAGGKRGRTKDADASPYAGLFTEDRKAQQRAVDALLSSSDKSVVVRVFSELRSSSAKARVLEGARRKDGDKAWLGALIDFAVKDADPEVRAQAAVTAEAAKIPNLLPSLLKAHKGEKDSETKLELMRAIAASAKGDKKAWSLLNSAVKERSDHARSMAYVAIARFGEDDNKLASKSVDLLLRRGLRDRDSRARGAAIWALGHLRSKRAVKEIERAQRKTRRAPAKRLFQKVLDRIGGQKVDGWTDLRRTLVRERVRR